MNNEKFEIIIFFHTEGHRAGDSQTFQQATVSIGRSVTSDLQFTGNSERSVSKNHAVIRAEPNGFKLIDMQSTNGTFVNSVRVTETWLNDGDLLRFGAMGPELRVSLPSLASEFTMVDSTITGLYRNPSGDKAVSLNEPGISRKLAIARQRRFVRNTMLVAVSVGAAMTGFVWSIIEGTGLTPAPLYFRSFLFLLIGGLLVTLVFAIYHGKPGRQKVKKSEILYMTVICTASFAAVWLSWWGAAT